MMANVNDTNVLMTKNNLETFSLFWLDAQVNTTDDNRKAQKKLRSIINQLKTFDDASQCRQFIESLSEQDRVILIVSGRLGRQIVPAIHHLRQLSSIYIYCMDKELNEEWAKQFTKVKNVITQLNELLVQIKLDQRSRVKIEEPIAFNIYSVTDDPNTSTTGLNGHFIHSLLLIDALVRLKPFAKDKQQLISLCKKEYEDNNSELDMIREFKHEYTSNKALWWYTRESFFYRMLNKALRVQNIELLLLFRSIINDIYQQLKQNQYKSSIKTYRGQIMWSQELEYLKRSVNQYISINSFLLTSTNHDKVVNSLNSSKFSDGQHRVLFIIDADSNVITTKPFADISKFNSFSEHVEILFMVGSIFRLIEIENEGNMSRIRMRLCGNDEHNLKYLFDYMKKINANRDEDNEIDLRGFGDVVHRMGKYDLAETIYRRALNDLSSNDPSLSDLYYALGMVSQDQGDYCSSLKWYQKSLGIKMRTHPSDSINIGRLHGCIGEAYSRNKNDNKALEYYQKAIQLFEGAHAEDNSHMADFYNNIGSIYKHQKKYSEALKFYEKALTINNKYSSSDRPNIAKSHNNIGIIHCYLNQYDLALKHCQQSLSIKLKTSSSEHLSIAKSYKNIGLVYDMKGDLQQALHYYQQAAIIYRRLLPSQHPDTMQIENDIRKVLRKLN